MESLKKIIESITQEAAQIQIQSRRLRPDEMSRVEAIYQALPHLENALEILTTKVASTLITYKIVSDLEGKLKQSARSACNFWNRFIVPSSSIVIRLGVFTSNSNTIARAYKPYRRNGVVYGIIEFNTKYLTSFSGNKISGTIIHEIGHTLGFGWDKWQNLFDSSNGMFTKYATDALSELKNMRVETDHGPGTRYSHWDEQRHDEELMTGFKDNTEHVLPVTIRVMKLLGHQVIEDLPVKTNLDSLLDSLTQIAFSRQVEAKSIDLDHFEETELWENVPHHNALSNK